jgi:hypothetical protein
MLDIREVVGVVEADRLSEWVREQAGDRMVMGKLAAQVCKIMATN